MEINSLNRTFLPQKTCQTIDWSFPESLQSLLRTYTLTSVQWTLMTSFETASLKKCTISSTAHSSYNFSCVQTQVLLILWWCKILTSKIWSRLRRRQQVQKLWIGDFFWEKETKFEIKIHIKKFEILQILIQNWFQGVIFLLYWHASLFRTKSNLNHYDFNRYFLRNEIFQIFRCKCCLFICQITKTLEDE